MEGKGGPDNLRCGYRGVRQRTWGKWVAEIRRPNNGGRKWLGTFDTSKEAALAYDKAARDLYSEVARVNFPTTVDIASITGNLCNEKPEVKLSEVKLTDDDLLKAYDHNDIFAWDYSDVATLSSLVAYHEAAFAYGDDDIFACNYFDKAALACHDEVALVYDDAVRVIPASSCMEEPEMNLPKLNSLDKDFVKADDLQTSFGEWPHDDDLQFDSSGIDLM